MLFDTMLLADEPEAIHPSQIYKRNYHCVEY